MSGLTVYGALAEFANPHVLYKACEKVRDAGFEDWDAHTPFPVHGLDDAMGLKPSIMAWICLVCGLSGAAGGFALQVWVSTVAYPMIIAGKPYLSWQAFIPVTFELGIICTALGAVIGMLTLNRLPRLHHPLFNSVRFEAFSDDKFFISIEAKDPKWDEGETTAFLQGLGADHVEIVLDLEDA
jgi:hypothetical protein